VLLCAVRSTAGGMLRGMIFSFGYLVLRQVFQLIILVVRGERCTCRELRPGWSSGVFVLVEEAAETVMAADA
jgi:hypothetical protein